MIHIDTHTEMHLETTLMKVGSELCSGPSNVVVDLVDHLTALWTEQCFHNWAAWKFHMFFSVDFYSCLTISTEWKLPISSYFHLSQSQHFCAEFRMFLWNYLTGEVHLVYLQFPNRPWTTKMLHSSAPPWHRHRADCLGHEVPCLSPWSWSLVKRTRSCLECRHDGILQSKNLGSTTSGSQNNLDRSPASFPCVALLGPWCVKISVFGNHHWFFGCCIHRQTVND